MTISRGCWVGDKETVQYSCAYPKVPLDTTGAGDLFASGFLHGYLKDCPLDVCAHYGALTGAAVVEVSGTDISIETWDQIRARIG